MSPTSTNSLNGTTEVIQLADLITASVKEVVNEYQAAGRVIPSIFSTDSGPFDAPHLTSANLNRAIQIIEAACAQLSYTVANPGHTVTNVFSSTSCIVLHIADDSYLAYTLQKAYGVRKYCFECRLVVLKTCCSLKNQLPSRWSSMRRLPIYW